MQIETGSDTISPPLEKKTAPDIGGDVGQLGLADASGEDVKC